MKVSCKHFEKVNKNEVVVTLFTFSKCLHDNYFILVYFFKVFTWQLLHSCLHFQSVYMTTTSFLFTFSNCLHDTEFILVYFFKVFTWQRLHSCLLFQSVYMATTSFLFTFSKCLDGNDFILLYFFKSVYMTTTSFFVNTLKK